MAQEGISTWEGTKCDENALERGNILGQHIPKAWWGRISQGDKDHVGS